ncbi:hypothetical protein BDV96DRAFT_603786 [Lophiotrema nucula]|uniref:Uncharacterized protein n=1 Tax=Lophiotrema nucula TaxID=690887 RepID=A0A6A5YX97_9PLEO|nr:hypothetical protein BDV96DRAFT_603786 [Lophiotrema nucula]
MPRYYNRVKVLDANRKLTVELFPPPDDKWDALPGDYRYKFNPPPRQKDRVISLIIKVMNDLAKTDMYFAASSIRVWNADETQPLWPPRPGYWKTSKRQTKLYVFKESYEEFPMTVPISVKRGPGGLSIERIQVKPERKGPWMDLEAWLRSLPVQDNSIYAQTKWWKRTGKTFKFMELPEELRWIIYRHILGCYIYPDTVRTYVNSSPIKEDIVCLGKGLRHTPKDYVLFGNASLQEIFAYRSPKTTVYVQPPNYQFLQVHSRLKDEALKAAWEGTRKHFLGSGVFDDVISCPNPPPYNWLSVVQLNFTSEDYFRFFGIKVYPTMQHESNNCTAQLLKNTSIKDLEMRFRHPHIGYEADPWGAKSGDFRRDRIWNEHKKHNMGCSKIVVDWILTFAFPYIKEIPKVKLTGSIKTTINEKWTSILRREYTERGDEVKSHGFGYEAEMERIMKTPQEYLPPACTCASSCYTEEFDVSHELPPDWQGWDAGFDHGDIQTQDCPQKFVTRRVIW